ncbi:MAG: hypothetical protein HY716_05120 [Planctomycetes bacterium]|nr:hypothetical protein [Planctomycetota bacterium]
MTRALIAAVLILSPLGCKPPTVEKTKIPPAQAPPPRAPADRATDDLSYTAPDGWIAETPASAMRKAQYRVPARSEGQGDAEMALFFFLGHSGSVEDNVSRWRAQFGEAEAKHHALEGAPTRITIVDISGTYAGDNQGDSMPNARMLAAIVPEPEGTWYFKLVGPSPTVSAWEESFLQMLRTVRFTE